MVSDENHAMLERELEDLPPDECFRLLATADVGRLVYQDDLGPLAVPVNYAMAGHDIVFRVERGAKQTAARQQQMLAFEVDHVDEDRHSGWSVLVRGVADEVDGERLPALMLQTMKGHVPMPWAAGARHVWLQLVPRTVTGRRLDAEWGIVTVRGPSATVPPGWG
jgi:nitroimidazol reductase NimA-like FMN-containing flavoprotein (pyridoxamine 5'-phosphate oxidase superfamily)